MRRSMLAAMLLSAALAGGGCLPASSPRVVTPAPLVGDALYRADGTVPGAAQLTAMVDDTLVRFHQAAQLDDFTPFVRWKARAAQNAEQPAELAATARRLALAGIDLASLRGVTPTWSAPPSIVDTPGPGTTLRVAAAYRVGARSLRVAVTYVEQQGQWKAGPMTLDVEP